MPSRKDQIEIRERGADIVRRHLDGHVNPNRLELLRYEGYDRPHWFLCLDGNKDNRVCYVGYGKMGTLVSFYVAPGRELRKYSTFGEAERDAVFKSQLLERVKELIREGGND